MVKGAAGTWGLAYGLLATWRGPHWALSPKEATACGEASVSMLEQAPVPTERTSFWMTIILGTGTLATVFGMRLAYDIRETRKLRAMHAEARAAEQSQTQTAAADPFAGIGQELPVRAYGLGQDDPGPTAFNAGVGRI